jgi:hypothetical protein
LVGGRKSGQRKGAISEDFSSKILGDFGGGEGHTRHVDLKIGGHYKGRVRRFNHYFDREPV